MLQYMCKRLLRSLVTLLIIVVVIFSLLRLMPEEGYFDNYDKLTPSEIENKLTLMGPSSFLSSWAAFCAATLAYPTDTAEMPQ